MQTAGWNNNRSLWIPQKAVSRVLSYVAQSPGWQRYKYVVATSSEGSSLIEPIIIMRRCCWSKTYDDTMFRRIAYVTDNIIAVMQYIFPTLHCVLQNLQKGVISYVRMRMLLQCMVRMWQTELVHGAIQNVSAHGSNRKFQGTNVDS